MLFDANKKKYKRVATITLCAMVFQIVFPAISFAQSGPTQQESTGYTHTSAGENVDNFTGDFSYGIPVMDIEGYPLVLTYNSNVTMSQEASWVGLGWNLNPGSIARQMRGVPDEFNGVDKIEEVHTNKNAKTDGKKWGVSTSIGLPIPKTPLYLGVNSYFMQGKYYNNYKGMGRTFDIGGGASIGTSIPSEGEVSGGSSASLGLGFSFDSQNGIGINPSIGFNASYGFPGSVSYGGTFSWNMNTREGLKSKTYHSSKALGAVVFSFSSSNTSVKTFGTQSHLPKLNYAMFGHSFTQRKGGGTYAGVLGASASFNGVTEKYKTESLLFTNNRAIPAYGYNNLELAGSDPTGVMDFNREKERVFSESMQSLPFTNITYDLYQVNSPGVASMFRAYRNDVGTLSDATLQSPHISSSLSTSKSFGIFYKSVKSFGAGINLTTSGNWEQTAENRMEYTNQALDHAGAEKFYFKKVGEKTPVNSELYDAYRQNEPVRIGMAQNASDKTFYTTNALVANGGGTSVMPTQNYQTEREIRAMAINYYHNHELALLNEPVLKDYDEYVAGGDGAQNYTVVNDSYRKEHHFGKMEVTSESGAIFGYGLPAYNITETDVVFNVEPGAGQVDPSTGLVNYETTDNSLANNKGRDHFYQKRTTPSYPHSYLITDMKSSDYVDKTGNGFSADDIGTYVKFNYSRIYGNTDGYKWRFPVSNKSPETAGYPKANYNIGHQTDGLDDKGMYNYGEKEMWFPHSIETKNYILEFYLENRKDAYPVKGENGELDVSKPSKCLKKMMLFSRNDRKKNGAAAIPLKTVEFHYDYSLCKNTPSNQHTLAGDNYAESGKLTLKSITFSSGNSKIQTQSPYVFSYETQNPDYNLLNVDRWGNYKVSDPLKTNTYFPYAVQDEATANANVKAWKLNKILFPTGGGMAITYEADRYKKIQDQDVMRHFQIAGMANFGDLMARLHLAPANNYATGLPIETRFRNGDEKKKPNNVVYFELDEPITGLTRDQADQELIKRYFTYNEDEVMEQLYYRTSVKTKETDAVYEYIPGFADIKQVVTTNDHEYKSYKSLIETVTGGDFVSKKGMGVVGGPTGDYHYGYVIVETVGIKSKLKGGDNWDEKGYPVHPMQKNAWNYVRANLPWKIYAKCLDADGNPSIDDCDYGVGSDFSMLFTGGINKLLNKKKYCLDFNAVLSSIRLMDPRGYKFGGNARVTSVTYFDSWDEMTAEPEATYTLEYDYANAARISGVAAYEPINGGDENIFFQPKYFNIDNLLKPDEEHYQIDPIGESVFPAPTVGYRTVHVKFKDRENLTRNATGKSTFEYYTYYDYPISVRKTDLNPLKVEGKSWALNYRSFGVSQGFVVELNDMHGKMKMSRVIDANDEQVSESIYDYFGFDDKQKVVDRDGSVTEEWLGKEVDIYADKKFVRNFVHNETSTKTKAIKLGIPKFSISNDKLKIRNDFYAATFQKVINHTAVLKEVKTTYLGQVSRSAVVAYDKYSGQPISQTVVDEFNENDYSINIPAHWRYDELKSRYKNQRFAVAGITIDALGKITPPSEHASYYSSGDILLLENEAGDVFKAYIKDITAAGELQLIKEDGSVFPAMTGMKLLNLRSGFKNRITEGMASYVLKHNPIGESNIAIDYTKVLVAQAAEYIENKAFVCESYSDCSSKQNPYFGCADPQGVMNPIKFGFVGNWKPYKTYAYQSERVNGDALNHTNIKTDGQLADFKPFYAYAAGKWYAINEEGHPNHVPTNVYQKWRPLQEVTQYDRFGHAVESRSQLGIYSSVLYGYNNNLKSVPIATALNAKVTQIAFDGFEDYTYLSEDVSCETTGHFDFKASAYGHSIVNNERHTGNYSLMAYPGQAFQVIRKTTICGQGSDCKCEPRFAPSPGRYVIGLWVKEANAKQKLVYEDAKAIVEIIDHSGTVVGTTHEFMPSGEIVDGWQRLEGVFDLSKDASGDGFCIRVTLKNEGQNKIYFDDVRIHPFTSAMTTMVYDSKLLLPLAQLNAYNFATFFMHDENLQQVRVRQETEKGIYTIQETNGGTKK